jgi:hypothetical protein
MTILWAGKLHVAPIENLEDPPADSKDAVVRMIGSPVVLKNQGSELRGASVGFHTGRQDGYVRGSEAIPIITATGADGAVIKAPNIEYSNAGELATIRGPSSADLPLPAKEGEKPQFVHAQWTKIARIYLAPAGPESQKLVIQRAVFDGEVHISQPQQLDLRTDNLALRFDPPRASPSPATIQETKQPELRQMIATGNVRTLLTDDAGKTQKINCDKLTLATERDAGGKLYPHLVKATGNVFAADPEQELRAGQMNLALKPSTRPARESTTQDVASTNVVLDHLDASDNVRIVTAGGSVAHGDHLTVQGEEGSRLVDLMGEPFALVGDKDSTLQGKLIHFEEATQKVEVNSPGRLHAIQQQQNAQGPTTRPIDVQWQQRLEVQGKQNVVDIFGNVEIASQTAEDQTLAKGNHVRLVLADKPPTTKPAADDAATSRPTTLADKNSPLNGFGDKTVKAFRIEENVVVDSKQTSDQDVTKLALFVPSLNYDMDAKLMVIDKPGRMLFQQDPLAGTTQPSTTPAANPGKSAAGDLSNLRGATAFEWQKEFRYDEAKLQAKMTGDVRIVHQASDLSGPSYELDAGVVTADLEQRPTDELVATTQPQQKMRVKMVVADRDVTFRSDKMHFDAQHVEFNPNTHVLIARGTDRSPAELHEAEGFSSGTFTELRMNTLTEEVEVRGFQAQIRQSRKQKTAAEP